ncbi:AzlC family ABC transporter permease [Clostridium sediminicola]|uniref:AzlC family ABC transporter permease n=1 Tax=Clostridium sediminicola TaxID=3114879 RepID=UPI003D1643D0
MVEKNSFQINDKNAVYDFYEGFKKGIPIFIGYIPVSFTFGLMAVNGGLPLGLAIFISLSNFTSAGQFAGTALIINGGSLLEIALTTLVINIRYMLMSLSLSQKISFKMPLSLRSIIAFGITDETFTIAALEEKTISFPFMMGIETGPYLGWIIGTTLGAVSCSFLPQNLENAMGIALYAMFIALVIPESRKSKPILIVTLGAVLVSSLLTWVPIFSNISSGFRIIIATLIASCLGAFYFPREEA